MQNTQGKGLLFADWMWCYHTGAYLWSVSRAIGRSRQDIGTKGCIPVLMNLPYYLEFLVLRLSCGGDRILEKNLYILLRLVEVVALLCVLSILHLTIVMPFHWLAGNCGDPAEYRFGVADMALAVDLVDNACKDISEDGSLFLMTAT